MYEPFDLTWKLTIPLELPDDYCNVNDALTIKHFTVNNLYQYIAKL